jgi:peptidoglycan/xylan/chitin deacetylase (PgdA/CDA1 family)
MTIKQYILKFIFQLNKPGVVFYGHNVTEHVGSKLIPSLHITPSEFESTIIRFKELDFEFIDMEKLIRISKCDFTHNKPWLHLTFDDGYQDNLDIILPILKKHQIPATIFVSSNHIAEKQRFYTYRIKLAVLYGTHPFQHKQWALTADADRNTRKKFYRAVVDDFKLMTAAEALSFMKKIENLIDRELQEKLNLEFSCDEVMDAYAFRKLATEELITIGSHNHDHVIMNDNVTDDEMEFQMSTSKHWIEKNTGSKCQSYCYPNGQEADYNERSKLVCKSYYELAFTTASGMVNKSTDKYEIPRMFLLPDCISIIHRMAFPSWVFRLRAKLG